MEMDVELLGHSESMSKIKFDAAVIALVGYGSLGY